MSDIEKNQREDLLKRVSDTYSTTHRVYTGSSLPIHILYTSIYMILSLSDIQWYCTVLHMYTK